MNRRELLRYTALATGAAVCSPLLSALLSGCATKEAAADAEYVPQFFTPDEFSTVRELVDVILPETDTPSASAVGVHRMMDTLVGVAYRPQHKEDYRRKIDALLAYLGENDFDSLNQQQRLELLQSVSQSADQQLKFAFLEFKQQTIALYLKTEEIGKNHLNYLPVPGKYEPCIALKDVNNKAWAL